MVNFGMKIQSHILFVHVKILPLLPPANEVWGKVICLQACVCPQGGAWSRGVSAPGGAWCWGVSALGGLVETPPTATAAGGTHPT